MLKNRFMVAGCTYVQYMTPSGHGHAQCKEKRAVTKRLADHCVSSHLCATISTLNPQFFCAISRTFLVEVQIHG